MDDKACVEFLQWALPKLHMRWEGFRKVRGQVCKRINRRLQTLKLPDVKSYQEHLRCHREEWEVLDGLCRVSVSRFYRDRMVFSALQSQILPAAVRSMRDRGEALLRVWSAGCGAGEEPYSLKILWEFGAMEQTSQTNIEIVATDSDRRQLARAVRACYPYSSIKNLTEDWRRNAFVEVDGEFCLSAPLRRDVRFLCQDVRHDIPPGAFDLILCRNLVLTYFDDDLQRQILRRLAGILQPNGFLIVGIHEILPKDYDEFAVLSQRLGIYRRRV
jgi:chemotaxis protein methyltransferase CheR